MPLLNRHNTAFIVSNGASSPEGMQMAILANCMRIFHGGGRALPIAGKKIGQSYVKAVKENYTNKKAPPASIPGRTPAERSGTLANSVGHTVGKMPGRLSAAHHGHLSGRPGTFIGENKAGSLPVRIRVFADTPYARRLEFGDHGNKKKGRIDARPLWRPLAQRPEIAAMIRHHTIKAFLLGEIFEAKKLMTGTFAGTSWGSGRNFTAKNMRKWRIR